jgi:hypothetical protein
VSRQRVQKMLDDAKAPIVPSMSELLKKLRGLFSRKPADPESLAEAERARDEVESVRLSQSAGAGSAGANYQSGRGSGSR